MISRLLVASLRRRPRQLLLVAAAVTLAATTVAALAGFSQRAARGLDPGLAAFGPNLVVRPQVGGPERLPVEDVERIRAAAGVESAAGVAGEAVLGETVPGVVRIEVRAERGRLRQVAEEIERRVAGAEARPLLRVSASEEALAGRLQRLLRVFAAVSVALALITVGAATAALVEQRRSEVGLFLALGLSAPRVAGLFAAELLAAALAAGFLGDLLGELAAHRLAASVLGVEGAAGVTGAGLAASALVAVLVVGCAAALSLRHIERLDPARVLAEE